ncbi:hypothetical protein [Streptomyces sp. NPDC017529]|uniref:hypothetical protein n=1 Tax=Streptomyces sp. NPDC017529 TaxID=3365000 RepID=UPI0037AD6E22
MFDRTSATATGSEAWRTTISLQGLREQLAGYAAGLDHNAASYEHTDAWREMANDLRTAGRDLDRQVDDLGEAPTHVHPGVNMS